MKTIITHIAIVLIIIFTGNAEVTLPSYIPNAPNAAKAVSDYTVADVMGCVCNLEKNLPAGHPFKVDDGEKILKTNWPGAKMPTNIDLFAEYLLATPVALTYTLEGREEKYIAENLYWILEKVMDVSISEKSSALVRVYNNQTDSNKKRKIIQFCAKVLPSYGDIQLLSIVKNALDDDTIVRKIRAEEAPTINLTLRGEMLKVISNFIVQPKYLGCAMSQNDYEYIFTQATSELEKCVRFKSWMNAKSQEIEMKLNEFKNRPNRIYVSPICMKFRIAENN